MHSCIHACYALLLLSRICSSNTLEGSFQIAVVFIFLHNGISHQGHCCCFLHPPCSMSRWPLAVTSPLLMVAIVVLLHESSNAADIFALNSEYGCSGCSMTASKAVYVVPALHLLVFVYRACQRRTQGVSVSCNPTGPATNPDSALAPSD